MINRGIKILENIEKFHGHVVLSNQDPKTQRHSIQSNIKQRKPANPHIAEATTVEGLVFFLNKNPKGLFSYELSWWLTN